MEGDIVIKMRQDKNVFQRINSFFKKVRALPKFIKDPNVKLWKKAMILGSIIYLISPIDLIPDPILGFGFIDDGVLILYIFSLVSNQLDRYVSKDADQKYSFQKDKIIEDVEYKIDDESDRQ